VPPTSLVPTPERRPSPPSDSLSRDTLGRDALERVLGRAAELQAAAGDTDSTTSEGGLTEAQLLEVGREVGISPTFLRQALAEERTRVAVPEERGLAAHVAGAGTASSSRTVRLAPADALAALNLIMLRDECLTVKRRYADRTTWEPRRDFWATFKRLSQAGGHAFDLLRAREVGATLVAVDERNTLVRLDADVSRTRAQRLQGGALVAGMGIAGGGAAAGVAFLVHAMLWGALAVGAVPVAAGVAAGVAVARTHRQTVGRVQLALEQVLDRLEHGDVRRYAR
jgi:hypothetical protein